MAEKNVVFSFQDASKEIKVGDKVYYRAAHVRSTEKGDELFVTRIGRTLVELSRDMQSFRPWVTFYFNGKEKTDYSSGTLYTSKQAYNTICDQNKTINEVVEFVRYKKVSYEQALKIKEILGME